MIYFRHPDMKMRPESFGGVIQTVSGIYVLTEAEYSFISSFQETRANQPVELLQQFLAMDAVCSITEEEVLTVC